MVGNGTLMVLLAAKRNEESVQASMKNKKIVHLFAGDDPRINSLLQDIKELIYKRGVGVFQLATVLGILRMIEHEIIKEMED